MVYFHAFYPFLF